MSETVAHRKTPVSRADARRGALPVDLPLLLARVNRFLPPHCTYASRRHHRDSLLLSQHASCRQIKAHFSSQSSLSSSETARRQAKAQKKTAPRVPASLTVNSAHNRAAKTGAFQRGDLEGIESE
ncbi:hypothetical protein MTO96_014302 [Rhipicephalus appendiculatus]